LSFLRKEILLHKGLYKALSLKGFVKRERSRWFHSIGVEYDVISITGNLNIRIVFMIRGGQCL
jgi:hypothetical protein